MSIRIAATAFAFSLATALMPTGAFAQANVMKECGAEYQSAKAANSLNGQKWQEFLSACRTRHAGSAPAATPTAATAPATTTAAPSVPPTGMAPTGGVSPSSKTPTAAAPAKPASGGRAAMLERQRACGTEWKAQKIELRKADPNLKWPQYWSACNKRMKAAAGQ